MDALPILNDKNFFGLLCCLIAVFDGFLWLIAQMNKVIGERKA